MSDLISRQAAIDAIRELESGEDFNFNNGLICAMNNVAELPSAQPEPKIIHCKDCRYRKTLQFFGRTEDFCGRHESFVELDDFCSAAQFEDDWMKYTE